MKTNILTKLASLRSRNLVVMSVFIVVTYVLTCVQMDFLEKHLQSERPALNLEWEGPYYLNHVDYHDVVSCEVDFGQLEVDPRLL